MREGESGNEIERWRYIRTYVYSGAVVYAPSWFYHWLIEVSWQAYGGGGGVVVVGRNARAAVASETEWTNE